jgi:hypothetical protein
VPKPGANGAPPGYIAVPQLRVYAPTPEPTPAGQPTSLLMRLRRLLSYVLSPTSAFACDYNLSWDGNYYSWDCDTPPALVNQFEGGGPGFGDSAGDYWIPPDTEGSVGINDAVTFVNGAYYVWDKTTGNLITDTTASDFWCPHYNLGAACNPVDPRIVHDKNNGDPRWIASSLAGTGSNAYWTLLAVSTSEDPAAYSGWHFYSVVSCNDGNYGDQPRLGFNAQWVTVFVDCPYGLNTVWVFDKANLYAGGSLTNKSWSSPSSASFQQPATGAPGTSYDETLVGVKDPTFQCGADTCFSSKTFNSVEIGLVSGPVDAPLYTPSYQTVTLPSSGNILAPAGQQLGTTVLVGNEQAVVQSTNVQLLPPFGMEYVFATFPLGKPASSPARSGVEWVQVDDYGTLVQSGIIQDTTNVKSYHDPSIAVNGYGYGLLGYSDFSKNYYPKGDYTVLDLNLPGSANGVQSYTPDGVVNLASDSFVTSST